MNRRGFDLFLEFPALIDPGFQIFLESRNLAFSEKFHGNDIVVSIVQPPVERVFVLHENIPDKHLNFATLAFGVE
jgi:hypothetical protein